jgi:hypothetical protein
MERGITARNAAPLAPYSALLSNYFKFFCPTFDHRNRFAAVLGSGNIAYAKG